MWAVLQHREQKVAEFDPLAVLLLCVEVLCVQQLEFDLDQERDERNERFGGFQILDSVFHAEGSVNVAAGVSQLHT